jgi:O-methyltransferase
MDAMSSHVPDTSLSWRWKTAALQTKRALAKTVKSVVRKAGYEISPYDGQRKRSYPADFTPGHISIVDTVRPYTMTPPERIYALIEAVGYIVRQKVPGAFVECGVWRGGSMMTAALALKDLNCSDRDLYLFDTFEGMPKPEAVDVDYDGNPAMATFAAQQTGEDTSLSCFADLADVRANMTKTRYASQRINFVKGKVEETIPAQAPETIAMLRLDTDWYASTRHELEHLYPRLSIGGVLIIDDYGAWQGARKATDEYLAAHGSSLLLNRIDFSARMAVKIA